MEINYSVKVYYKDIKNLCSSVRNMGEPILNPEGENAESGANVPDPVNKPGYSIPSICEKNNYSRIYLQNLRHYEKEYQHTTYGKSQASKI